MKKRIVALLLSLTLCFSTAMEAGAATFTSPEDQTAAELPVSEALFTADVATDEAEPAQPTVAEETVPEETMPEETAPEETLPDEDAFGGDQTVTEEFVPEEAAPEETLPGITEEPTAPEQEETPAEDVFSSDPFTDGMGGGTDPLQAVQSSGVDGMMAGEDENTEAVGAAAAVTVKNTDWIDLGNGKYKLKKTVKAASAEMEAVQDEETVSVSEDVIENVVEEETAEPVEAADDARATSYYTAKDGLLRITTVSGAETHTGYYIFDNAGVMVTGKKVIVPGTPGYTLTANHEFFFADTANAVVYGEYTSTSKKPWNSDLGQMKKSFWLWEKVSGVFRYYDASGKYAPMSSISTQTGYYEIDGEFYCLDENGKPRVGDIKITGGTRPGIYYFQPAKNSTSIPGKMFYGGWRMTKDANGERWRYYRVSDPKPGDTVNTTLYKGMLYERGIVATKLDVNKKGKYTYLLDGNGYILKSALRKAANGIYYGTDKYGRIYRSKMARVNGYRYYFDKNGKCVTNKLVKTNNARYYFTSSGKLASWKNSWRKCPGAGNRYYYFGSVRGKVVEKRGMQKVASSSGKFYGWFYFPKSGNHYKNYLAKDGRYYKPKGGLAGGINTVNGKTYFFEYSNKTTYRGKMFKNTLISYKNKWYYASSTGALYKGWKYINGNYYYFQDDFTAMTNKYVTRKSPNGTTTNGYLDSTGKFCTGWIIVSNAKNLVRYVDPSGRGYVKNTSKVINGLRYYFDKNGYRRTDLTSMYRGPYYLEVDRVNGVMTVYDSTRTVPVKTIRVSVGLPGTPTGPVGYYNLRQSLRWQPLMGPSWGQYGTHVVGAGQGGIFVHSVAGGGPNSHSLPGNEYNKLGNPASHGCIRVCVADAKWVFYNCNGATLRIFDGSYKADEAMKGPLGRNPLIPLRYPYNFDPTDVEA